MAADRPEKHAIRGLWSGEAAHFLATYRNPDERDRVPLYLTLSGAEGKDIERLVTDGVLRRTETGAIAAADLDRVIAVESNPGAEIAVRTKYPGLSTYRASFQDLVGGGRLTSFPQTAYRRACRARIVNLDLTQSLNADAWNGAGLPSFPVLGWVRKLGQLHVEEPRLDWCLCLTLNATITWPSAVSAWVRDFLADNFTQEPAFGAGCARLLGAELHGRISSRSTLDFVALPHDDRQRVLMALVPKMIAHLVYPDGWRLSTTRNLRYGGSGADAPMVSWVFRFTSDTQSLTSPLNLYRENLRNALVSAGWIGTDGCIAGGP